MDYKHWFEEFKQLPSLTQIALMVFVLVMVLLLVTFPTSGTNIIAFLVALKMLASQQSHR